MKILLRIHFILISSKTRRYEQWRFRQRRSCFWVQARPHTTDRKSLPQKQRKSRSGECIKICTPNFCGTPFGFACNVLMNWIVGVWMIVSCRIINNRQLFIHRSETLTAFSFYWIVLRLTERILLSLSGLFLPSRICVLAIWITRYQRQSSFISTMGLLIFL